MSKALHGYFYVSSLCQGVLTGWRITFASVLSIVKYQTGRSKDQIYQLFHIICVYMQ